MAGIEKLLERMRNSPESMRFSEVCRVCEHFFGEPRRSGGSHRVYRTPWKGDPRVNIQERKGMAKPYQVRQVLKAINRLRSG